MNVMNISKTVISDKKTISILKNGLSNYSPQWRHSPPHYVVLTMIGGAIGFLTTNLGGGAIMGKTKKKFQKLSVFSFS